MVLPTLMAWDDLRGLLSPKPGVISSEYLGVALLCTEASAITALLMPARKGVDPATAANFIVHLRRWLILLAKKANCANAEM